MTNETIFETSVDDFDTTVLQASHEKAVLVDFWADWCPPCISLDPVLKKVVLDLSEHVQLAKVEVDDGDNMKLAGQYQLRGFPTVILFMNGEEQGRFSGFKPEEQIRDFLADCGLVI